VICEFESYEMFVCVILIDFSGFEFGDEDMKRRGKLKIVFYI